VLSEDRVLPPSTIADMVATARGTRLQAACTLSHARNEADGRQAIVSQRRIVTSVHPWSVTTAQAAILTGDDCLRLDGSNSGGDFTREAAGCFSRDRTSVALLPAAASDASESMQVIQALGLGLNPRPWQDSQLASRRSALCERPDTRLQVSTAVGMAHGSASQAVGACDAERLAAVPQAVAHMVLLGCGAAGASGSMPPVGGSYSNCAVHVPACAQAA